MHWRQFGKTSKAGYRIVGEIFPGRLAVNITSCMLMRSRSYDGKFSHIFRLSLVVPVVSRTVEPDLGQI